MVPNRCSSPLKAADFRQWTNPQQSSALVEVASNTTLGQPLAFKISGTGLLPKVAPVDKTTPAVEAAATARRSEARRFPRRPGGGLGPPIEAPDPLDKYRWYIPGGLRHRFSGGRDIHAQDDPRAFLVADYSDIEAELPVRPRQPAPRRPLHDPTCC